MSDLPKKNTGLLTEFSPNIWLAGDIPYEVVLESGDWRPFNVTPEKQKDPVETMSCVTFSLLNNYEIQHKFKGIDINLSDKFTAKASDTQQNGNTFERVIDSTRKIGVVREEVYPNNPKAQTWNEYHSPIPADIFARATKVDANYGIIPKANDWSAQLKKYLKQSPLWITWPASPYHAMNLLHVSGPTGYVKDHYQDIKQVPVSDIAIAAVVKLNKLINTNMNSVTINIDGTIYVGHELNDPKDIPYANKFLGSNLVQLPDGTIPTDIKATKK